MKLPRLFIASMVLIFAATAAHAQYAPTPVPFPTDNTLDDFINLYRGRAATWQATIAMRARAVFLILAGIEMAWTAIMLAIRQADLQEFVAEMVKRIFFFGFFWLLFLNGPVWAQAIIDSLYITANNATAISGGVGGITPSLLFDIAGNLFMDVTSSMSMFDIVAGLAAVLVGIVICVTLAITAAYLVVALVETYICVNAGIILLGFGGSRWTKNYALAYLRFAFGAGMKLFITQLIIGIGSAVIADWMHYAHLNPDWATLKGLMLLGGVNIVQAIMVAKIPAIAQGLVQGVTIGGGDELAAPMRMGATVAAAATGAGTAAVAAKAAAGRTIGGARAVRSATRAASASLPATAGQAAGARVGSAIAARGQVAAAAANRVAGRLAQIGNSARSSTNMAARIFGSAASALGRAASATATGIQNVSNAGASAAARATIAAARGSMIAGGATARLAQASARDYLARNDGSNRGFGTFGGRIARAIRTNNHED